jgi:hypothetical protein
MKHKVIIATISILILVVVVGGLIHIKQFKLMEPELGPPLAESTEITPGSAKVWVGLKNSDDQGTSFDLRAELLKNGTVIASGEARCITGVTRNPNNAKEVTVQFGPITNEDVAAGDVLFLKILTRIGTKADGTQCAGHSNAVGLRFYYDGTTRPSRFGAAIPQTSLKDFFLHSGSSDFFDTTAPTAATAKFKDSLGVNFKLQGHDSEQCQEGQTSGMPTRKGALSIFFLGLITLSDKCNTKSVCPPFKNSKKMIALDLQLRILLCSL